MSSATPLYDLKYKPRTQGLTAAGYKLAPLLRNIDRPISSHSVSAGMPSKAYGKAAQNAPQNEASNVYAEPHVDTIASSQSSSEEDTTANIQVTNFATRAGSARKDKKISKKVAVNGRDTQPSRIEEAKSSPSSSSGSSTAKRKNPAVQQDKFLARSMLDPFGRPQKRPKSTYKTVTHPLRVPITREPSTRKSAGSPKTNFQKPEFDLDLLDSPVNSQGSEASPPKKLLVDPGEIGSSPEMPKATASRKRLEVPAGVENSPTLVPATGISFKNPGLLDDSWTSDGKIVGSYTEGGKLDGGSPVAKQLLSEKVDRIASEVSDRKREPIRLLDITQYRLDGDLQSKIQSIVGEDGDDFIPDLNICDDEFDTSMTIHARCPMCNQPCDASELKKMGTMNTRQQEKFCRSHRKSHAEKNWESKGYPKIDWDRLESRISRHHDLIQTLLHGKDCYYRREFEDLVAAGKGRSLKKMEANPIPGYYGSRGLNIISRHVIDEFSELLSDRSMDDALISKRGTASFVQLVIVPEVTIKLIMEDMLLDELGARDVLTDSSNIGELVHEEIRDVVTEQVDNCANDDVEED